MSRHRLADATGVRVMAEMCPTCIFRPGNRMQLRPGRLRDMVEDARRVDGMIVCHHTLDQELQACCRGHYDTERSSLVEVATRLDAIVWWTPPDLREEGR